MDKTSFIGLILGLIAVGVGMMVKGVSLGALINPAALLIIILGTIATVVIAFPTSEIKRIPKLIKIIFTEKKEFDKYELIQKFSQWGNVARVEGILGLEKYADETEDAFLKNGLELAVEGQNADYIRDILTEEIEAMESRHASGASIFSQAGTYAPTLGVLGAVVGLIAALSNMADTDALSKAISAAFIATLMGIFTGYVLWHPFANKLKQKSKKEAEVRYMMVEGILSIIEGDSPKKITSKLSSIYLSEGERKVLQNKLSEAVGEAVGE